MKKWKSVQRRKKCGAVEKENDDKGAREVNEAKIYHLIAKQPRNIKIKLK